ncbi:Rha family transcriptional regulator [Pseudomonas panipatensis]|uniref:Phage regulatory protein Rha (Phage_pRha) n=1 Tax=Pseudomonas panipatensis TaxID=428992 RepID=A0A1G8HJC7_9PSED|nr:Rha family transcriptional regulator [Pseudomonas panipatensis]SDI06764.1 Phage regulatory protein Rha (Phage_pRha) [Pseudomonas panipatensis]SMP58627.1 Phage regulatory protein Rha (Phage_pRha) [Pseudomonas panipatensis]
MNDLTTTGGQAATMSSREIADLVEARHNDVVATIERLFDKGLLRSSRKTRRESTGGRPIDVYDLIERDTHLIVAGYSDEHRARVIDRWQQLEAERSAGTFLVPRTRAEALRLAADLEEQNAALQLENQHQAVTIASLESLFMAGETPTQFCKRLNGVNCARVNSTLLELGWLYDEQREEQGSPRYRVASRVRDKYLTERPRKIAPEGSESFIKYDLQLLLAGAQRLHQLYMQQKLAMKTTWDGRFTQAKYTVETIQ